MKNQALLAYFALTFLFSWGGMLILSAPYGMPTTSTLFEKNYPIVLLPYLLGPLASGLILTGFVDGRKGFNDLWSRLVRWKVDFKWYLIGLLTAPLLVICTLFLFSRFSPAYLPAISTTDDRVSLLLMGIGIGLFGGGFLEEPGWTGFALPRFRKRYSVFISGLILGLIWGVWHFLPTYWGSGDSSGQLSLAQLLPPLFFYTAVLPAYRILMAWVYDQTGSLLVMILMHASLTASTLFVLAPAVDGISLTLYYLALAIVLWLMAAIVLSTHRRKPARN